MRLALALPFALALACGAVPEVSFYGADGSVDDGGSVEAGVDAGGDGAPGADTGGGTEAGDDGGGSTDASDDGHVTSDAPYCFGKGPPPGAKCCPSGGPVCYGTCNKNDCTVCGPCPYPSFCCTAGPSGVCQSTPCGTADAGGD
jgi:hypothetical protein